MANWTDNPPVFNPYVQQLPVEAMTQVGMQKQQQYNEGIQRIQSQIDNVAGIDVIRDVDKQYLQSKLDNLGDSLKTVAAGDFSNFQLTNSVGGMVSRIAKDPTVLNAVMSTQKVRKAITDKETANKTGKGAVENDWFLDKDINQYLNNADTKASFSGGYIEYKDVKTKMIEVLKSLHESGKDEQFPWDTNADGTINYGKTAAAMVEKGKKGITSGKIENAIRASLDQNDLRQLQISGQYQFRNYAPEDLIKHAQGQYDQGIKKINNEITNLQKYAASNSGNPAIVNETNAAIRELQVTIAEGGDYQKSLKAQLQNSIAAINSNPDAVKGELYKDGFVKEFAGANSWEESAIKYVTNPYVVNDQWERKFGFEQVQFNETKRHSQFMEGIALENLGVSKAELKLKQDAVGGGSFQTSGGLSQVEAQPRKRILDETEAAKKVADAMEIKLAEDIRKSIINSGGDPKVQFTVDDAKKVIDGTYKGEFATKIGPQFKSSIDAIVEQRREVGLKSSAYNSAVAAVDNNPDLQAAKEAMNLELQNHNSIVVNGEVFTPKEIVDFLVKPKFVIIPMGGQWGTSSAVEDLSQLSKKERLLYNTGQGGNLTNEYKEFLKGNSKYLNDYNKQLDKEILERTPEYTPKTVSVGTSEAIKKTYNDIAVKVLARSVGNNAGNLGLDTDELSKWLTDEKINSKLEYGIRHTGKNKQLVVSYGSAEQVVTLTDKEASQIKQAITSPEVSVKEEMIMLGGTTNAAKGDPSGAKWQKFPNIKKSQVVADIVGDINNPNIVFPVIKVNTSEGWKELIFTETMSIERSIIAFNTITDEYIEEQLKKQIPNFNGTILTK